MYSLAQTICSSNRIEPAQANELVKATYGAMYKSMNDLSNPEMFSTWCESVMRNVAKEQFNIKDDVSEEAEKTAPEIAVIPNHIIKNGIEEKEGILDRGIFQNNSSSNTGGKLGQTQSEATTIERHNFDMNQSLSAKHRKARNRSDNRRIDRTKESTVASRTAAKAANKSLGVKVIAGIVVAAVVVGGYGISKNQHGGTISNQSENTIDKKVATAYEQVLVDRFYENDYRGIGSSVGYMEQATIAQAPVWKQTALCDITGDNVPELFYGRDILSYVDGEAVDIACEEYYADDTKNQFCEGVCAVGETDSSNVLGTIEYSSKNHDAFYRLVYYEGLASKMEIYKFELDEWGFLYKTMVLSHWDYGDVPGQGYYLDDQEITQNEFDNILQNTVEDFGDVINYAMPSELSIHDDRFAEPLERAGMLSLFEALRDSDCLAMEYDEMLEYLRANSNSEVSMSSETQAFIDAIPGCWVSDKADLFELTDDGEFYATTMDGIGIYGYWTIVGFQEIRVHSFDVDGSYFSMTWVDDTDTLYQYMNGIEYHRAPGANYEEAEKNLFN